MFEKKQLLATLSWIFAATIVAGVTFAGYRLMQTQQHLAKVVANLSLEGRKPKLTAMNLRRNWKRPVRRWTGLKELWWNPIPALCTCEDQC